MSNNDLIRRVDAERARDELVRVLNYINTSGTLDYTDYCELFDTIEREFDALKVVPHEMSAREFFATIQRMCPKIGCDNCPGDEGDYCILDFVQDSEIEFVEKWAREHPEGGD